MWNILSWFRRNNPAAADHGSLVPGDLPPPSPPSRRGRIADFEFIGSTAVATLTVTELSHVAGAEELAALLEELSESGARNYVLDVQNVQHMDSGCLGVLVQATNRLAIHGGRIALVNADRSVSYLFKLTRLDRVFPICRDVMAAMSVLERTGRNEDAA